MQALSARFAEESSLELHSFLSHPLAQSVEHLLRELDVQDGLGDDRGGRVPPHTAGTNGSWLIKGPPHKWRYCVLKPREGGRPVAAVAPRAAHASSDEILRSLQDELFPSPAFRAWMAIVSRLLPMSYSTEARRFRPGLDYTLATSEEMDVRLDVVLGLTPGVKGAEVGDTSYSGKDMALARAVQDVRGWQAAEWGGWEVSTILISRSLSKLILYQCYMAPHNEGDDPAVYRSSAHKTNTTNGSSNVDRRESTSTGNHASSSTAYGYSNDKPRRSPSTDIDEEMEDEEEEDSTLLTVQPGFNRLLLVLRDERVMRFVKYVSAAAEGSRWDVCGEYEVGMMAEDEDDE